MILPNINPHCCSQIKLYYQNVRGLRTKSAEIYSSAHTVDYDIIVLTETWLNQAHHSAEYFDSTFNVFRKDRAETGSSLNRGGGVLIATKSS